MGDQGGTLRPHGQNAAERAMWNDIEDAKREGRIHLRLSTYGIREIPESVLDLRKLESLHLELSPGFFLPAWLRELPSLYRLDLSTTRWTRLPPLVGELNVRILSWMANDLDLALDADWLPWLPHVKTLVLYGDAFTTIPESVQALPALEEIEVLTRNLRDLPRLSAAPPRLKRVHIDDCVLTELPDWFADLDYLRVRSSRTFVDPPPEVMAQGAEAILAYLRARAAQPPTRQWGSKLLIVGEATVGKTSLANRLTGKPYDPDEGQTHGVHVDPLLIPHPTEPDVTMELRMWDFGGQLEYRATQRFYLTDRSLFVLVWNSRARWRDGKVTAWLDVIAARAPHSPVLIVATHGDEPSAATLPSDLPERYPQIKGMFTIDSASGSGMDALQDALRQEAAGLPLMGRTWPAAWAKAGAEVLALPGNAATARQVWKCMTDAGVPEEQAQQVIARCLHDLGDIVYFADDPELSQRVILHPTWLDKRISDVLDSPDVAHRRGVLSRAERERLWGDLDDPDLNDRLIRMMERFDLGYRIGDAETSDGVALIVERLDDARPARIRDRWEQVGRDPEIREIGIAYRLKSRQAGIPTWFIAREHRFTTDMHWSHGTLLHDRDQDHPAWALLVDDGRDQPTIELRVRSRFPVRFLSVLAEAFEQILSERYPGLLENRLIPCVCSPLPQPACTHLFTLEELLLEAGDTVSGTDGKVRCPRSRLRLDARTMLDGLRGTALEAAVSELGSTVRQLHHVIDEQSSVLTRIDQRGLATLNGVRMLLEHRSDAGVHCPSLFEVVEKGRTGFPPLTTYELRLWCEWPYGPNGPHALDGESGTYLVRRLPSWLRDYLPYLSALVGAIGIVAPLAKTGLTAAGVQLGERGGAGFETVAKLAEDLKDSGRSRGRQTSQFLRDAGLGAYSHAETGADFRALRHALTELDPQQGWGGLSPVERPEDRRVVYLCREHVRTLQFPYTD